MNFKITINKESLIICIIIGACIFSSLALPGMLAAIISMVGVLCIAIIGRNSVLVNKSKTNSVLLCIPIFLSAFQNVYLAMGVNNQTSLSLQILLSLHFLFIFFIIILNVDRVFFKASNTIWLVIIIIFYGIILYIIHPAPLPSLLSSVRNILSPLIIFIFATVVGEHCNNAKYYRILLGISWIVVIFGLFEYIGGIDVWRNLGVTRLWNLKGIITNSVGIPMNWFSSEIIGGQQVRRMVSSFADPVNLGTYLFAAFMIAWYCRKKILALSLALCCVLTVSKGALLGFLVFFIIYFWFKDKSKIAVPIIFSFCSLIALIFIEYSLATSTGSVMAHISGFLSSLNLLITNPFGLGIGNVGVLSGLFSSSLSNTDVIETGIGVVIAQLGWIGLLCYIIFFGIIFLKPKKWRIKNNNSRILYYTLLFSFILNALFNEVALSPNSCALYFIELAFINENMKKYGMKEIN